MILNPKLTRIFLMGQLLATAFLAQTDCNAQTRERASKHPKAQAVQSIGKNNFLYPADMTPYKFLSTVESQKTDSRSLNVITIFDDFPKNWLTSEVIDSLVKMLDSKKKCRCFLNPLSSHIPMNDSADLGGYAIKLVTSYKAGEKISFGLYSCPKTDITNVLLLRNWWTKKKWSY